MASGIYYVEFEDKAAFSKLGEITGTPENTARIGAHRIRTENRFGCGWLAEIV